MKLHLTKIVEDRSPVVVTKALEKSLKREAWEIHRSDQHVVALGIGTSRSAVNLSDKATFEIDVREGATTVQVEAEYQYTWFLSEEAQNDTVHSRIESVFATRRAELDLAPELLNAPSAVPDPPPPGSEITTQPDDSMEAIATPALPEGYRAPAQPAALLEVDEHSQAPTSVSEVQEASTYLAAPTLATPRFESAAVPLSMVSILVALCVIFGIWHFTTLPISRNATKPVPSVAIATPTSLPPLGIHPTPPIFLRTKQPNPPAIPSQSDSQSEDLMRWLQQWAASERTRDAKTQASFYADDVRPYLSLDRATRDAIYRNKQDSIQNRKGLWTFKIDKVAIRSASGDEASVVLKKVVMAQTNSVEVSEKRISSFLTLKRTQNGWQITGERDLR